MKRLWLAGISPLSAIVMRPAGLPRIPSASNVRPGIAESKPNGLVASASSLPRIAPSSSSALARTSSVVPEEGYVVQTSSSGQGGEPSLPVQWTNKHLEFADDVQRNKVEWENEIARHILSLYATTTAAKNMKESRSLLDFVGEGEAEHYHHAITNRVPGFDEPPPPQPVQEKRKKAKKGKRVKHKEQGAAADDGHKVALIDEILSKIDNYADLSSEKNVYRVTNTIRTRDGTEIVVRGTPRCFPIWFTATGDVYANWTKLPGRRHLQAHLSALYEHGFYKEYLLILETVLIELFRLAVHGPQTFGIGSFGLSSRDVQSNTNSSTKKATKGSSSTAGQQAWIDSLLAQSRHLVAPRSFDEDDDAETEGELSIEDITLLFQQLIMTTLAIVVLCIEKKQFEAAMRFIHKAEAHCGNIELLPVAAVRRYHKGYVCDAMAYYFFKRRKLLAAKEYAERAMAVFEQTRDYEGVGACLLHIAAVQSGLSLFKDAHRVLYQFLAMVESGRLSMVAASPKQLCMVSVAYHNLAVVQLKLDCSDLACKNSQNARKIARLCLSFSNRYIDTFQYTHSVAISDMKYDLSSRTAEDFTAEQLAVIKELSEALFAVDTEGTPGSGTNGHKIGLKL